MSVSQTFSLSADISANARPTLVNLSGDRARAAAGGPPALLDVGSDATILGGGPWDSLQVTLTNFDAFDLLGIRQTPSILRVAGTALFVHEVEIGEIDLTLPGVLYLTFNANAATSAVETLIHSLTYQNTSPQADLVMDRTIGFGLADMGGGRITGASLKAAVAPMMAPFVLTAGTDAFTGDIDANIVEATQATLTAGDWLDGGGGNDTLVLNSGGVFEFDGLQVFQSIETIVGATGKDDVLKMHASQLQGVKAIDGGGGVLGDRLTLLGASIDLTGTTITGVEIIELANDSTVTVSDVATALHVIDEIGGSNELILTQGTLTQAEKNTIYSHGIEVITINGQSETHAAPVLFDLDGDRIAAVENIPVFVDALRNSRLLLDNVAPDHVEFRFNGGVVDPQDSLGIDVGGGITLGAGYMKDSVVSVTIGNTTTAIGSLLIAQKNFLYVEFNPLATAAMVDILMHAITYTRSIGSTTGGFWIEATVVDTTNAQTINYIDVDPPSTPPPPPANGAPTNITLSATTPTELAANGTVVGALAAIDADANEAFTYTLLDSAGGRFAIRDGKLVVADGIRLDFEQAASHQVSVRVSDKAGHTIDRSFTIAIGDVANEFSTGTQRDDRLVGGAGNDTFSGGAGVDLLFGGAGADRLSGGLGRDLLTGGAGRDIFLFDSAVAKKKNANIDTIADFVVRDDGIYLENGIFKGLGKKGTVAKPAKLGKDAFWKGAKAHDASDRIVYNQKTGALYYDEDGNGSKSAIQIGTLPKKLKTMNEKDFFII